MTLRRACAILSANGHRNCRWISRTRGGPHAVGIWVGYEFVTLTEFEAVAISERYARLADEKVTAKPPRRNTYEQWANGGGPNECRHGIAAGLTCHECPRSAG